MKRTTIVDVARVAGVSKSLVSLALRGDNGVSATTRTRILQIADELGYRRNHAASSLVSGSSGLFGVLLTDLANPYHTGIVRGIEDATDVAHMGVILTHGRREPERLGTQLEALVNIGVDGIIVISAHAPFQAIERASASVPLVVIGRPESLPAGVSQLRNDDEAGTHMSVEHLISRGRKRIGFLQMSRSPAARAREETYRRLLQEHQMAPKVFSPENLAAALAELDAVVASNDRGAVLAIGEAHDAGLQVPEDLAVVGYDDSALATIMRPQLSSVSQPLESMGTRAVELLTSNTRSSETFVPKLVLRESS